MEAIPDHMLCMVMGGRKTYSSSLHSPSVQILTQKITTLNHDSSGANWCFSGFTAEVVPQCDIRWGVNPDAHEGTAAPKCY